MVTPSENRTLAEELDRAISLQEFIKETIGSASAERSTPCILSGTLYHLSYEHSCAMLLLIKHGIQGSALALARPAYDALLRGAWVLYSATNEKVESIITDNSPFPGNKDMSLGVTACAPQELKSIIGAVHRALPEPIRHGLTHGGTEQLKKRFDGITIKAKFSEETVIGFIRLASTIMIGSAVGIALQPGCNIDKLVVLERFLSAFEESDSEVQAMLENIEQTGRP